MTPEQEAESLYDILDAMTPVCSEGIGAMARAVFKALNKGKIRNMNEDKQNDNKTRK